MEEKERNLPKIDLIYLLRIWLHRAGKHWALALAAMLLCALLLGIRQYRAYTPVYEAQMSFTVRAAAQTGVSTKQLHAAFPQILRSEILQQRIRAYLGVDWIPDVSTAVLENSNIFTISVRHPDPQQAYQVLKAVAACYPQVADYVVGPTEMVVLDDSGVPEGPVYALKLGEALILGAAAGLLIWAAALLLMAQNRRSIFDADDVKRTLNCDCLGILPAAKAVRRSKSLICEDRGSAGFRDSVQLLQMHIQKEMRQQGHQILLVSGALSGEGKTTIAVSLAAAFARKGSRVLLVDGNRYNPSVQKALGMFQRGMVRRSEGIRESGIRGLYLLSADVDVRDARNKQLLQELLAEARGAFDYVIVDTPACSFVADAAELSDLADCALMVIRQDYASRAQIFEGIQLLTENGLPMLGCAINGVSGISANRGYGRK